MSKLHKVAVATYHYSFNEGAILQAYAVTQLVETHLGKKADLIDQRYPGKQAIYGAPNDNRKEALQASIDHWLPLSSASFRSRDNRAVFDYINNNYDAFIVGSDVIWNLRYKRHLRRFLPGGGIFPHQPYPFFTPFPNIYWPDKSIKIPKYAYAASIGTLEYNAIPGRHRRNMKQILSGFSAISVRDERTRRFVEWVDPNLAKDVVIVPDPTLGIALLELNRLESLKEKLIALGVDFSRPRCGIICEGDHMPTRKTAEYLKAKGYQIIGITAANPFSDINLFAHGFHPMEWALLFRYMDICITERMHGAIFCLKNLTPFIILDINETKHDNDSKTVSLMRRFGLEAFRVVKKQANADHMIELTKELKADQAPWNQVHFVLDRCEKEASNFFQAIGKVM
ncbi:MAG TPA: polysaccharide pyruvyl transferase family protein [Saprospiraceae bacterium]|nr:polysaccharide pyruvyl transferase family protein [Saprospiraceae bacterium]HMP13714.1 polysaccharide pyruvyl transferase family protein [Saprospiraceae bacterium]